MNVAKPRGKLLAIHYGLSEHSVEPFVYFPCSHRDSFVIPRLLNGKCVQNCRENFNSIFRGRSQTPLFHFYFLKEKKSFFVPHSNGGELSRVEFVHRRPKLISTQHLDSIKNVSFHSALVVASVTVDAWLATTKQRAPSIILIRSLQFA